MGKSSTSKVARKQGKPHPDFPLFKHATGRWAKKVRGKLHYFGKVATDPEGESALLLWLERKDDLLAGRTPHPAEDSLKVADLCNSFLTHKKQLLESDELARRTFDRYYSTCSFLIQNFGKKRPTSDLRPKDFQKLRDAMAKRWGPVCVGNEVQIVRSIFKYGFEAGLLNRPIIFGPGLEKTIGENLAAEPPIQRPPHVHPRANP